jgi:hypothetical protein
MNRFQSIFNEINKYINYMLYDEYIIFSSNYVVCMNKILYVLKNTLSKIQNIYFKYILHPKLNAATVAMPIP